MYRFIFLLFAAPFLLAAEASDHATESPIAGLVSAQKEASEAAAHAIVDRLGNDAETWAGDFPATSIDLDDGTFDLLVHKSNCVVPVDVNTGIFPRYGLHKRLYAVFAVEPCPDRDAGASDRMLSVASPVHVLVGKSKLDPSRPPTDPYMHQTFIDGVFSRGHESFIRAQARYLLPSPDTSRIVDAGFFSSDFEAGRIEYEFHALIEMTKPTEVTALFSKQIVVEDRVLVFRLLEPVSTFAELPQGSTDLNLIPLLTMAALNRLVRHGP